MILGIKYNNLTGEIISYKKNCSTKHLTAEQFRELYATCFTCVVSDITSSIFTVVIDTNNIRHLGIEKLYDRVKTMDRNKTIKQILNVK